MVTWPLIRFKLNKPPFLLLLIEWYWWNHRGCYIQFITLQNPNFGNLAGVWSAPAAGGQISPCGSRRSTAPNALGQSATLAASPRNTATLEPATAHLPTDKLIRPGWLGSAWRISNGKLSDIVFFRYEYYVSWHTVVIEQEVFQVHKYFGLNQLIFNEECGNFQDLGHTLSQQLRDLY